MIAPIKVSSMYYKIISLYKKLILQLMKIAYKIAKICILNISKLIYYDFIIFMGGQRVGYIIILSLYGLILLLHI